MDEKWRWRNSSRWRRRISGKRKARVEEMEKLEACGTVERMDFKEEC